MNLLKSTLLFGLIALSAIPARASNCRLYKLMEATYSGAYVYDHSKMWICKNERNVIVQARLRDWGSPGHQMDLSRITFEAGGIVNIAFDQYTSIFVREVPGKDEYDYGYAYRVFEKKLDPMTKAEYEADQKLAIDLANTKPEMPAGGTGSNSWSVNGSGTIQLNWKHGKIISADLINWGGSGQYRNIQTVQATDGFIEIRLGSTSIIYLKPIDSKTLSYSYDERSFSFNSQKAVLIH